MSTYQIHNPRHIKEAVEMMSKLENASYIANGTKLLPLIKQRKRALSHLISLEGTEDLRNITKLNGVRLGSGLTFPEIGQNDLIQKQYTALYDAVCGLSLTTKNGGGTLGGDLCSAYPFALMACPMLLFDADVAAAGMYPATHSSGTGVKGGFFGSRIIRIDSFFPTRDTTVLKQDELVKEFVLPFLPEYTGSAYVKIKRSNADYLGITGIGARLSMHVQGNFAASKEALGGGGDLAGILRTFAESGLMCSDVRLTVAYTRDLPRRLRAGEDELRGHLLSADVFNNAVHAAAKEVMSKAQGKVEAWYGGEMVKMLLERSVLKAIDRVIRPEADIRPERAW